MELWVRTHYGAVGEDTLWSCGLGHTMELWVRTHYGAVG